MMPEKASYFLLLLITLPDSFHLNEIVSMKNCSNFKLPLGGCYIQSTLSEDSVPAWKPSVSKQVEWRRYIYKSQ